MSKTPVSILQEYCTRNVIFPQYDLVINGVGTHNPLFRYKLTVNEIVTFGDGKSKKEAKHEAAKAALQMLPGGNNNMPSRPEILDRVEDITSPYQDALKENAIGDLIVICTNNRLPEPEYVQVGEEGPPHAKLFTYECRVAKLTETAASRTKKQAKHLSAKLMLQRLMTMLGDKLELSPPDPGEDNKEAEGKELDENAKKAYATCKVPKFNENFDLLIRDYHLVDLSSIFRDNPSSIIQLSSYDVNETSSAVDPVHFLQELFKEAEVEITFKELPSRTLDTFIFVCELDSSPTFVEFGVGKYKEVAIRDAAHKMLCLLRLFCCENHS